jgi:uncharacterized RDD family membrane protein YckC
MEDSYKITEGHDQQEHLLDDLEYTYTQASANKRFGNYLIDRIAYYFIWRGFSAMAARPMAFILIKTTHDRTVMTFEVYLMALVAFVVYFTAFEGFTKGKTLGKWITGTRAVTIDGRMVTLKIAFLRSLCRLVPLEPFSAIKTPCYPWHDRWTRTLVIVEKLSNLPPEA